MNTILKKLEDFLVKNDYPIISHLQEGKNNSEIIEPFKNLKLPVRDDIVQMYQWKNGVKGLYETNTGELELFTSGIMMPLEHAVSIYVLEAKVQKYFSKVFFPLFTSGGGDYILIHLDESKKVFGQIFLYSPSILLSAETVPIYDSLTSLFETVLEVYRQRGYFFSENDKSLEIDYDIEREVSRRMNPKSEFWIDN